MQNAKRFKFLFVLVWVVSLLTPYQPTVFSAPFAEISGERAVLSQPLLAQAEILDPYNLYLPLVARRYPPFQPFGLESHSQFTNSTILDWTQTLNIGWARMGVRVSWRDLQPIEGDPIDWDLLAAFDDELRQLKSIGVRPVIVVTHSPGWALQPGITDYCGPVASDKFDDFGAFIGQLAAHYGTSEFGVTDWEIGNEIDVDPQLVLEDSGFGCWGDMYDPYYGGRYYGQMLKVVTPMIRAKLPGARIWLGGLLLDSPNSSGDAGYPERFLEGVLLAGAAPYFDVLPYHWYPSYFRYYPYTGAPLTRYDYDLYQNKWADWGGGTKGKATFLKSILAKYGVNKPLSLNETALGCAEWFSGCDPDVDLEPPEDFQQAQADFVVRSAMRAIYAGVNNYSWFMIKDPSWRYTGLLDPFFNPKPVAIAYQTLIDQYHAGTFKGAVSYGTGIEGYAVERDQEIVHVVWTVADETRTVSFPTSKLLAIYNRDGVSLPLPYSQDGDTYYFNVTFSPTYFHLAP